MALERVVIVGSGQGGYQLAASLRQDGFTGKIKLIGDEPGLPYQRPPLSKAFMKDGNAERLLLKPRAFYDRSDITLIAGRVAAIDRERAQVMTADGAGHAFDHLVLATGARNLIPPLDGLADAGVMGLRTLAEAGALRARMATAARAVVIGGGFIGLEFAAVARAAGIEVTVLEASDRLMARAVSPEISAHFLAAHTEMGTDLRLGARAAAFEPGAVLLASGERVPGDLLLLAVGVRPNVELAEAAGLDLANGVAVDSRLVTSAAEISALGDCAAFPLADGSRVRLESVQAAVDHARHIARRLVTGDDAPYLAVPWFWSDQADLKLQIAGLRQPDHRRIVAPAEAGKLVVLNLDGEVLRAVETVNAPAPHMAARRLLAGPPLRLAEIEAADCDLQRLARERPAAA